MGLETDKPLAFSAVKETDIIWTTRDKQIIPIEQMSDVHVYKCVQLLEKYRAKVPTIMLGRIPGIIEKYPELLL